jgi:hypothetical protein
MGKARQKHKRAAAERRAAALEHGRHACHPRWPALTGLRGLAASGCCSCTPTRWRGHPEAWPALAWLFRMGWSGVDVFFTLSAFLLTLALRGGARSGEAEPSLREYWRHRAWRILPAYWVQVAILFVLALAGFTAASRVEVARCRHLLRNALFLYNLAPGFGARCRLVDPAGGNWASTCCCPGSRACCGRRVALAAAGGGGEPGWRWWVLMPVSAASRRCTGAITCRAGCTSSSSACSRPGCSSPALDSWRHGRPATRSARPRRDWRSWPCRRSAWSRTGGCTPARRLGASLLLGWHLYASVVVALLLLALASGPSRLARLFEAGGLQALGLVSYSLYLWHYPVMLAVRASLGGYRIVTAEFAPFLFYSAAVFPAGRGGVVVAGGTARAAAGAPR